jgi:hypothetical protein
MKPRDNRTPGLFDDLDASDTATKPAEYLGCAFPLEATNGQASGHGRATDIEPDQDVNPYEGLD